MLAVLALCVVGAAAAPNTYGSYDAAAVRDFTPAYAAPVRTYGEVKSYEPIVKKVVPIVSYTLNDDNHGTFNFEQVSADGSVIKESGSLKNLKKGPTVVMTGSYSFIGEDDGKTYTTNWSADENGFVASGAHLPTPVPMPAELVRAYDEARAAVPTSSEYSSEYSEYSPMVRTSNYETPAIRVVSKPY